MVERLEESLSRLTAWIRQHPQRISAALAAVLMAGGGGAYAVATLGPDAAAMPVQELVESVSPLALAPQLAALERMNLQLQRSEMTRSSDTPEALLQRLGVRDAEAAAFLRRSPEARQALFGRAGRLVTADASRANELLALTTRWITSDTDTEFKRFVVKRGPAGFTARIEIAPLVATQRLGSGAIQSSLFAATDEARIPDAVAVQIAEIFSGDIDFRRDLRKGDRFSVVFESLEADGEPLRTGRVLSTEFVNASRTFQAVWFSEAGQDGGYFTLDGRSTNKVYLASPLLFSRVSSGYGMRFHPIHGDRRAHLGVDYAAPTGTPVRTVGDGVVEFAGWQRGYGNVVVISHRNQDSTLYAHLSRIDVRKGQRVSQGHFIGAVGSTGASTGPHLHFEFKVAGVHQDPLLVARRSESVPLPAHLKPRFDALAQTQKHNLVAAATMLPAGFQ